MKRVYPAQYEIRPIFAVLEDDADTVRLVSTDVVTINADELAEWVTGKLPGAVAELEANLNAP